MKIYVKVKTHSKEARVEKTGVNIFSVHLKVPPIENRANKDLFETMAEHLGIPTTKIIIISGKNSKNRALEIEN